MLKSILNTNAFTKLKQDITSPSHAYLFYGEDGALNIELARLFIASIFCGKPACLQCDACKRVDINKNPDLLIIDKPTLQVADIESLIDNVQLKPMVYSHKIIFITNAEGINEIAQNKLLKTLEEPNPQVIFVLACSNIEKLLPTIKSRLNKHYVQSVDLSIVAQDLKENGINVDRFLHCDITLTDAIKYSQPQDAEIVSAVEQSLLQLKNSADVPLIVGKIKIATDQRKEFLKLLANATNCALTNAQGVFSAQSIQHMQSTYSPQVLIKIAKLIDESVAKLSANVNFNYILDQLFYNILKENYLCK